MDGDCGAFHLMSRHRNGNMILCSIEIDGIPSREFIYRKLHNIAEQHTNLSYIPLEKKGFFRNTFHWKHGILNLENHFIYTKKKKYDSKNFRRFINKCLASSLPSGRPEWQCHYLVYEKSNKSFIIWKSHHTYGDGFLLSEYIKKFTDVGSIHYPKKIRKRPSFVKMMYSLIVTFVTLLHFIFIYKKEYSEIDHPNADNDPTLFYHCKTWDINEIKYLKNYYSVTVNDLLYTIIIKSLRKYCNKPINISSLTTFNLRDYAQEENMINSNPNDIGFMLVTNNIGDDEDIADLLDRCHEKFENYKNSPLTDIIIQSLRSIYYISPKLVVSMLSFMGHKSTFGISNFRTFSDCNYIDGCKIKNISSMVVPYRMGMLFNIVSYDDKITLNMTYRKRNLKFPKKFIKGLEDIYQDLLEKSKI